MIVVGSELEGLGLQKPLTIHETSQHPPLIKPYNGPLYNPALYNKPVNRLEYSLHNSLTP